jgi:eukaryotic-like serine/threonine-protein kinase
VLKTLQREPQQRYADAQALADDLGRFLDDRPVLALLPSWRARAGQFVRRYPALVATTLVIGLALIATTGLALREAHLAQAALLSCPVPPPPAE